MDQDKIRQALFPNQSPEQFAEKVATLQGEFAGLHPEEQDRIRTKLDQMDKHVVIEVARTWREQNGYIGRGGVVVLFHGEVQSWVNELRNPEHWQPGCVAIDEQGHTWMSVAGNERVGALKWVPNDPLND